MTAEQTSGQDLGDTELQHLRASVALASEAAARGDRPFGAVFVTADGARLAHGRNEATSSGDPTAHAELVALRAVVSAGGGGRLIGGTVYASGEPCPMCAAATVWAGVGRIVYATSTARFSELLPGGPSFTLTCRDVVAASSSPVEVVGPALPDEGLVPFQEAADGRGSAPS